MHNSRQIADILLRKAAIEGKAVTPLKMIKLVYFCHGWMLGLYGRPLISEHVEAWRYGPAIKDLYTAVRKFRDMPITTIKAKGVAILDAQEANVVNQVWEVYGNETGITLSTLAHAEGTPWHKIWRLEGQNSIMSNDIIEDYYAGLYRNQSCRPGVH